MHIMYNFESLAVTLTSSKCSHKHPQRWALHSLCARSTFFTFQWASRTLWLGSTPAGTTKWKKNFKQKAEDHMACKPHCWVSTKEKLWKTRKENKRRKTPGEVHVPSRISACTHNLSCTEACQSQEVREESPAAIMRLQQDPRETETEEDSKERACPGVDQGNEGMPESWGPSPCCLAWLEKQAKRKQIKRGWLGGQGLSG